MSKRKKTKEVIIEKDPALLYDLVELYRKSDYIVEEFSNFKDVKGLLKKLKKLGIKPYRVEIKDASYRIYPTKESYIKALEEDTKNIENDIEKAKGEIDKLKRKIETTREE